MVVYVMYDTMRKITGRRSGRKDRKMRSPVTQSIISVVEQWLRKTTDEIDHDAVIKDVAHEAEISAGYFLTLTAANLIALSGLITSSAPVIIGAMLISPLMGPILSFGFAFVTGDREIWRQSVRKISVSVSLTLVVAALASTVSPLREITQEIVSRTRPNLYDLLVAFLAGSAGPGHRAAPFGRADHKSLPGRRDLRGEVVVGKSREDHRALDDNGLFRRLSR
ncbi:MAG TPA: DUF389 domain-containing protein [Nitrospirota bacterium]|nr:DUF389 domain-containing protein [Nitrospirota bacterium]